MWFEHDDIQQLSHFVVDFQWLLINVDHLQISGSEAEKLPGQTIAMGVTSLKLNGQFSSIDAEHTGAENTESLNLQSVSKESASEQNGDRTNEAFDGK